jgi:hypothetical protein
VITQNRYETFRDSINKLIQEYRERFLVPMIINWYQYEPTYRKRMLGMFRDLRSMIDHTSSMEVGEF